MPQELSKSANYWQSVVNPRVSALPNLRKIAEYMAKEGHTHPNNLISAYALSFKVDINLTQLTNLLNKPGFVSVYVNDKRKGWYFDTALGITYPEKFSRSDKIVRSVYFTEEVMAKATAEQVVNAEVSRAQSGGQAGTFASHNVPSMPLADGVQTDGANYTIEQVLDTIRAAFLAVKKGTREPNVPGTLAYNIATRLRDGTLTLKNLE